MEAAGWERLARVYVLACSEYFVIILVANVCILFAGRMTRQRHTREAYLPSRGDSTLLDTADSFVLGLFNIWEFA